MTVHLFAPDCYCYRTWNLCPPCAALNAGPATPAADAHLASMAEASPDYRETWETYGTQGP